MAIEIDDLDLRKGLVESADRRRKAIENNRKGDAEYWKGYEQALWDVQHNALIAPATV